MDTILLDNLSKTYPGGKQALTGISLSLGEGEIFGFLGPNGAGKTTTVKLLTGIFLPPGDAARSWGQILPGSRKRPMQKPEWSLNMPRCMIISPDWRICCSTPLYSVSLPAKEGPGYDPSLPSWPGEQCSSKTVRIFHRYASEAFPCQSFDPPASGPFSG